MINVVFIVPYYLENQKRKLSPFLLPQINSIVPFLEDHKIIYLESGLNLFKIYKNLKKLNNVTSMRKNYIIVSMYGSLHGFITALLLKNKFKIINTFGGSDLLGSSNNSIYWNTRNFITKIFSLYTAKKVDHVIVKSESLFNILRDKIKTPISILPNGVDLKLFKEINNKQKLRKKLNFKTDEFIVLFNSRRENSILQSVKNFDLAKKTIKSLKLKTKKKIILKIISNKSQSQINELFNAADCLLLTSFHEGSPNIIKEAMAANFPIVSVDVGDVNERLKTCFNCYISNRYCDDELSNLLLKVLRLNQRTNGRSKLIEQKIDLESIANNIFEILKSLS
jgi:teichuronic acid biosynthesis glycosyltransferase TuaC